MTPRKLEPRPGFQLEIDFDGRVRPFVFLEHPAAPGVAHQMQGAKGLVFRVQFDRDLFALKVMRLRHRTPDLEAACEAVRDLADVEGLAVCRRICITPRHAPLAFERWSDLAYAVLMPWIDAPSWYQVMELRRPLPDGAALEVARRLARLLAWLEARGIAHCDLSSNNVLLPIHGERFSVQLIDVEDIYRPGKQPPAVLTLGTPGYQHRESRNGQWGRYADRFAGAVLLAEMLGWADPRVLGAAYGESFFDPAEVHDAGSARFRLLQESAEKRAPGVSALFERAWRAHMMADCPSMNEWAACLEAPHAEFRTSTSVAFEPLPAPSPIVFAPAVWEELPPTGASPAALPSFEPLPAVLPPPPTAVWQSWKSTKT